MKSLVTCIITFIIIFILGYFLIGSGCSILGSVNSDNTGLIIVLSASYLSAIIGGSTVVILEKMRKKD